MSCLRAVGVCGHAATHLETLYDFAQEVVYRAGVAQVLCELALVEMKWP